jgi:undecaprenyl-diphosphatase
MPVDSNLSRSGTTAPTVPTSEEAVTAATPRWSSRVAGRNLARVALAGAAAGVFAVLVLLVRLRWLPMESVDEGLAKALNESVAENPRLVAGLRQITNLGGHAFLGWCVAIATVLLAVRRRYRLAVYLLVTAAGALILDPALKHVIGRLRPVVENPVAYGGGNSFPSGHSLGSIIVYGALLLVFAPAMTVRARRVATVAVAVVVTGVGFTRLALGVHFLSDVIGAWCLGVVWLGITTYAFELHRREHGRRVTRPLAEGLEPEAADDLKPAGPQVAAEVVRTKIAVAGSAVAWVLVFGVLCAIGIPLARYHGGNGNILGDHTIPHWLAAHRTPVLDDVSYLGSQAGNTHLILAVGLIAGAVALAVSRQWRPVVFLVVTMFGELSLFLTAAAFVDRVRPDVPHLDGRLPTSSFPSGHVAATILLYAAIAVLAMPRVRHWWRWLFLTAAVLMPLWVATSRMYRGMHHPTDVLGSMILAAGWLAAMVYFVRPNCDLDSDGGCPPADAPAKVAARATS